MCNMAYSYFLIVFKYGVQYKVEFTHILNSEKSLSWILDSCIEQYHCCSSLQGQPFNGRNESEDLGETAERSKE